jgi:hypothetical protein
MSDWFDIQEKTAQETFNAGEAAQQIREQTIEGVRPIQQRMRDMEETHSSLPVMNPYEHEQYERYILPGIASSSDPEAAQERFNSALIFSKFLDKPVMETYQNLEYYKRWWIGTSQTDKTAPKAIADSFGMAFESMRFNMLGTQLLLSGGSDKEIEAQLAESTKRLESLQDNVPRPWYLDAIKYGAQSLPYTIAAGAAGALSGGFAAAAGLSSFLISGASLMGAGAASFAMMEGAEYADLRSQGVTHEIAAPVSAISTLIQSGIEAALGNVPGISRLTKSTETVTGEVLKRLFISGKASRFAKHFGAMAGLGYAGEAVEEGAEEALQSLTSSAALAVSSWLQKEGVDTETAEEVASKAAESFKGGLLSSLILGVPSSLIGYGNNTKEALRMADMAKAFDDEQTYIKEAEKANFSLLSEMEPNEKKDALSAIWKAKRKSTEYKLLEEVLETQDLAPGTEKDKQGQNDAEPVPRKKEYRTDKGRLYTQFSNDTIQDGKTSGVFKVGNALEETKNNRYGHIRYTQEGDTVTITDFQMIRSREDIRDEFFADFAEHFAGYEIVWEPETDAGIDIKERLIAKNPRGSNAGLSYYEIDSIDDAKTKQKITEKLQQYMPRLSSDEQAVAIEILNARSKVMDMSLSEYVDIYYSEELLTHEDPKNQDGTAAQMEGKKGAVSWPEIGADVRALIHVTETSDFSTWVHENAHIFRKQLAGESLIEAERAFLVKDGKWTKEKEEAFAMGFEDYLREGKAPREGLKTLYQKVADFLRNIYKTLRNRVVISPDIRTVYDKLLAKEKQENKETRQKAPPQEPITNETLNQSTAEQINDAFNEAGKTITGTIPENRYHTDDNAILFQTEEELIKDAKTFDTWEDFMELYETEWTRPENAHVPEHADAQWYETFWEKANGIYPEEYEVYDKEDKQQERDDASPNSPVEMDALWMASFLRPGRLEAFLERIGQIVTTEPWQPLDEEDLAAVNRHMEIRDRINRELRHGSWVSNAIRVLSGKELTQKQKRMLSSLIEAAPRDYRSLYAEIMEEPEWEVALADTTAEQLKTKIADPEQTSLDRMSPEQRRRISEEVDDKEVARGLSDGTQTMVDEKLKNYIKRKEQAKKESDKKLEELKKEIEEDNRRISDRQTRKLLDLYDAMLIARSKWKNRNDKTARMIEKGIKITKRYRYESRHIKANYDTISRKIEDTSKAMEISGYLKEAIARREAQYDERIKNEELKRKAQVIAAIKKMRTRLVKRTMRYVSFSKVDYDYAVKIITIQRMFQHSLFEGLNKWIGTEGPLLRSVYSQYKTDAEFRAEIHRKTTPKRARRIDKLLSKPYESLTKRDRLTLHKILPKENWIEKLGLSASEKNWKEAVQLGIVEKRNEKGEVITIKLDENLARMMEETLPYDLYSRIQNRPFADWTLEEMEQLAKAVDDLYTKGVTEYKAKEITRKLREDEARNKVKAVITKTGIVIDKDDTPEEKEKKQRKIERILGRYNFGVKGTITDKSGRRKAALRNILNGYTDANIRRVSRILDNGTDGINTSLLYWAEDRAFNAKQRQIHTRQNSIAQSMEKLKINTNELFNQVTIDKFYPDGKAQTFTIDELLFLIKAGEDKNSRDAVIYGNMMAETEREQYKRTGTEESFTQFVNIAEGRYNRILDAAKEYFTGENKKFLKFADAISKDYEIQYERLNKASIDEFNQPVWRVHNYVPLIRMESSGEPHINRVMEDLLGASNTQVQTKVSRGNTVKRMEISATNQKPVELGLYKTWVDSVERTEYFINYAPLVRTLNSVYKSSWYAGGIRQMLQNRYGDGMVRYIDAYINELANPNAAGQRTALDTIARTLRGKTATAYLAWKTSGIIKQLLTSPAPFFQHISLPEYIKATLDFIQHPNQVGEVIRNKSAFMKSRTFDSMEILIREQQQRTTSKIGYTIDTFNNIGMKGLEMVDWICVAPGWLAAYRKQLNLVQKKNQEEYKKKLEEYHQSQYDDVLPTEESKAAKAESEIKGEDEIEAEAIRRADDIVRLTQPSGRMVDLAPMFKTRGPNSEFPALLLQFQTALNVIWQNIRYDLPMAVRNKQYSQAAGAIIGYTVAGITLGLVTEGLGGDEEEKKAQRLLYYSVTQFTDSVPLLGNAVTNIAEKVLTGRGSYMPSKLLPVWDEFSLGTKNLADAIQKGSNEDPEAAHKAWIKSAENFAELFGYAFGLPVSGVKEAGRTIGIGDGNGSLGFNPGALLGRRE